MAKSINLLNKVLSVGFLYQFLRSHLNEYVAQETPRRRVPCGTNQHQKSWMKREHFPMMIIWELFLNYLHRRPLSSSASGRSVVLLCSSSWLGILWLWLVFVGQLIMMLPHASYRYATEWKECLSIFSEEFPSTNHYYHSRRSSSSLLLFIATPKWMERDEILCFWRKA